MWNPALLKSIWTIIINSYYIYFFKMLFPSCVFWKFLGTMTITAARKNPRAHIANSKCNSSQKNNHNFCHRRHIQVQGKKFTKWNEYFGICEHLKPPQQNRIQGQEDPSSNIRQVLTSVRRCYYQLKPLF